ncbi:MAG: NYN domain-containing protein [Syntrophobacteraceae bacterium]
MDRTTFLIDGFNLYHSVRSASKDMRGATTKWLDISSLCRSYLPVLGATSRIKEIFYFSALAKHLEATNPDVTQRHRHFIRCLESTGIVVELARFKAKEIWCPFCNKQIIRHEEKETDVAISVKLMELLFFDKCDTAVLMTGDTDLAPAVRTAKRLFPNKRICF